MNRMHQIYVGILISILVATCLASENKPFYEVMHEQDFPFQIEDYHADLVLGMLPHIKTSIKDFRKRNFTNHDIENMYQTLTIFWPVIRKYLYLKEEFVDNESSEVNQYDLLNLNSSSPDNNSISIKNKVELDDIRTRSKMGQKQISQSSPLFYKRNQPIPTQIELVNTSSHNKQRVISLPKASVMPNSNNKENINGGRYTAQFKSIREYSPIINDKSIIKNNFQSARIPFAKNNRANIRPYKTPIDKSVLASTRRPSIQPPKLIHLEPIPSTTERSVKSTRNEPFSYTTRRPYSKTYKRLSKGNLSSAVKALLQSTGTTITRNNSEERRPYKAIRKIPFPTPTRRPSRRPSQLIRQDNISTTDESSIITSTLISTPVFSSTTFRNPYSSQDSSQDSISTPIISTTTTTRSPPSIQTKSLSQDLISTQEESPFASFYHKLLRTSALRLLQTATQKSPTDNRSKYTRTEGRSISTTISKPISESTNKHTTAKSTRGAVGFQPTITTEKSIATTLSSLISPSTISHIASPSISSSIPLAQENLNARNSATNGDGVTVRPSTKTIEQPINENTFYYTDISSILQALGNPIDLTHVSG